MPNSSSRRAARFLRLLAASASFVAFSAVAAHAGDLRGVVTDSNTEGRLEGVTLRLNENGRTAVTDRSGAFSFLGLPEGNYSLTADFVGYDPAKQSVHVDREGVAEVNLTIGGELAVEGITLTATRAAQAEALQVKRSATVIVDALSADDVGKLPDNNAADAVQRLPGVSVTIDQGEGRYVVVRGVDSNLVNVTVNGQVFPGPEGGARRVALDTFPSDIISRLEVIKAQTPDLDANAIGGTVNIVTPSAFDTPDGFRRASARYGYSDLGGHSTYAANASIGQLFGANKTVGVVLAGSYSSRTFESDNYETSGYTQLVPTFTTRVLRDYQILRERTGLIGNLEWRPSDALRIYLNNTYTRYADDEQRDSVTFERAGRGTVELRDRKVVQTLLNNSLGLDYDAGQFHLDLNATFAQADEDTPKRIDWEFRSGAATFANNMVDTSGPFIGINAPNLGNAALYPFRRVRNRTDDVQETTKAFTTDLRYDFAQMPGFLKLGVRGVDRDKSWDRTNNDFGTVTSGTFVLADVSRPGASDHLDDYFDLGHVIDRAKITDYFNANRARFAPDAASSLANSLVTDFNASERVLAGYGMGEFTFAGAVITAGVRVERTEATYSSYNIQRANGAIIGYPIRSGGTQYTHTLPDVLLRYNMGDNLVFRAAWTNTIGRPNYTDLVPRRDFDALPSATVAGQFQGAYSEGNPDLKAYESENMDASIEYYLKPAGILSLGLFHKDIDNPIYTRTINNYNVAFEGRQFSQLDVTRPENAANGQITGIEINYQQQFTFLPPVLKGIGVSANYTQVKSSLDVPGRTDRLPFYRQSKDLANVALFYERFGFEGRLALTHRGPYLETITVPGLDVYAAKRNQVDLKMSYTLSDRYSLSVEALNLSHTPLRLYSGKPSRIVQEERYGPAFYLGLNAKF